jgi:molecular chaperone GrpE
MSDDKAKIQELETKISELQKQADEYLNGWKRAKADYLNLERETDREKVGWIKFANLELILHLLAVLDSFDESIKHLPEKLKNDEWAKGILKIKEQLDNFIKAQGVERIKTIGEKFNVDEHEVVEKRGDKGMIIEEVQPGYKMNDKVIKPSKVIIE